MKSVLSWISELDLQKHPEGGYYRETYRSAVQIGTCCLSKSYGSPRSVSTAIYYLLRRNDFSALHRIRSDEIWHFYTGAPLILHIIQTEGKYEKIILGTHPDEGESFQAVVRAGTWFGATVKPPGAYTLVGCTVAPGFDFKDFETGRRDELLRMYPTCKAIIKKLTR